MAPWQYTSSTEAAVNRLVAVATGKEGHARIYALQKEHMLDTCLYWGINHMLLSSQEVHLSQPCCNSRLAYPEQMLWASLSKVSRQQ